MILRKLLKIIFLTAVFLLVSSCHRKEKTAGEFRVVTTTTMITDLVRIIGGDSVAVAGLMGAGVDPHLYKASEGDVEILANSDVIFYNGLHLEGKMAEVFEKMNVSGYTTYAVSDGVNKDQLIASQEFSDNYDPHIWFSVKNWKAAAAFVSKKLEQNRPSAAAYFQENLRNYNLRLDAMETELKKTAALVPAEKRILVTAHDAFAYFGQEFNFEVIALQGLSTATEAGTKDLLDLANVIVEKNIPAIFVESSVPEKTIIALQKAVEAKGKEVALGGTLYSDALGNPGTPAGTYIGMYQTNMETIANALKSDE